MALNGIGHLQAIKMDSNVENQGHQREKMENALEVHQQHVNEGYEAAMNKIQEDKEAREKSSWGALLGTIFLGPLIGTAIGEAIGGWANDGDEAASRRFGVAAEKHGVKAKHAFEDFEDAKDALDEAGEQDDVAKDIQDELSQIGWNNIR